MTSGADFKVRNMTTGGAWSPLSDGGFDCAAGDVLELQLEASPALDVRTCIYSTVAASKGASALALAGDGVASPPAATVQVTVPAGVHSWMVRCQVNGGESVLDRTGRPDFGINTRQRVVAVRSAQALRKGLASETTEYSQTGGWMDAQNEEVDAIATLGGGGGGGGLTLTTVKTAYSEATIGELVRVDASAGDLTIVAPTAIGHAGEQWGVLRVEGTLPSAHVVTISADDGINEEGSRILTESRTCTVMRSSGTTWLVQTEHLDSTAGTATPQGVGTMGNAGTSHGIAREDHVHALGFTAVQSALSGASSPVGFGSQRITGLADGVAASDAATVGQLGGGAPSRIVALDANDVIEWKLDDAAGPWLNTGSGGAAADLAAYGTPYIAMGSIHGDRCVSVNYTDNSALISGNTTVGQSDTGTVHGWVKPAYVENSYGGTLIAKGEVNVSDLAIYAGTGNAYGVGLSVILGTASFAAYRDGNAASSDGWLQRGVWSHVALTWSDAGVYLFVNGRKGVAMGTCTIPVTWAGTKWRIGQGQTYQMNAEHSMWRVCNVIRSDAYIDEVFRRGVGWYP